MSLSWGQQIRRLLAGKPPILFLRDLQDAKGWVKIDTQRWRRWATLRRYYHELGYR